MMRLGVEGLPVGNLDHLAQVHHRDAVGDVLNDRKVMRNEQVRGTEAVLQVLEQVQNLRLDGDVERGNGLVADDELRLERERAGDADTLALTAGKLMRVTVDVLRVEAHDVEELAHGLHALLLRAHVVDRHGLRHDLADGHTRVQARIWILEDELHVAAHLLELLVAHLRDIFALEIHLARGGVGQPHDGAARRGLTAAGFTHEAEGLARMDLERNIVYCGNNALREPTGEHARLRRELLA